MAILQPAEDESYQPEWSSLRLTVPYQPVRIIPIRLGISFFWIQIFFCWFPLWTMADLANPKRVLILFTTRQSLPISTLWERGIRMGIEQSFPSQVVFDCEYVDFTRLQSDEYRSQWMSLLKVKYTNDPPDVVIPVHDLASIYLATSEPKLFADADIVFCSISEATLSRLPLTSRMTGVVYRLEFDKTLELARKMFPTVNNVVVVSGSSEIDFTVLNAAKTIFDEQVNLQFTYWTGIPRDELCSRSAQLGPESIILFLAHEVDRNGKSSISSRDILQSLSQSSKAPVFGLYDSLIGWGVIGGQMAMVEEQGIRAGTIAGQILSGAAASDIEFSGTEMNRPIFDWRELNRWSIEETTIPPDSIVLFRNPSFSFWSQYWSYILLAGTVLTAQLILIAILLVNRKQKQRVQAKLGEMLHFQTLISEISAGLLEEGSESLSDRIDEAFRPFCEFMRLPHWIVYYLAGNQPYSLKRISSSHEGITDQKSHLTTKQIPKLWEKLQRGEFVNFLPSSELEIEFQLLAQEVNFLAELDSTFVIPLRDHQQTIGLVLLGVDSARDLAVELREDRLRLFSDLIAQYLARANAMQAIAQGRHQARRLTGRLLTAQEDERKRIAREFHDDISQRLAVVGMQVDTIERQILDDATPRFSLDQLKGSLVSLSTDVQRISRELHPKILDDLGLVDAIRSECHRLSEGGFLQVEFRCHELPDPINRDAALCLFRIVQESLWNVVKHAGVQQAKIVLQADPEAIYLEVSDQGHGFDLNQINAVSGLGLVSFRERVSLLGGTIEISSAANHGTRISVTLPFADNES